MISFLTIAFTISFGWPDLGLSTAFLMGSSKNRFDSSNHARVDHNHEVLCDEGSLLSNHEWKFMLDRRRVLDESIVVSSLLSAVVLPNTSDANAEVSNIYEIQDPDTYSAVAYIPPLNSSKDPMVVPLMVILHGAGKNQGSALYEFTNCGSSASPRGDHSQLPLAFLSNHQAPAALADNFVVVAPYVGRGKEGSLYDEPRAKVLSFITWFRQWVTRHQSSLRIDPEKISLFGFSEGATLAVELATTRQFHALILASYGFTGTLPRLAIERLNGVSMWVFHSEGDEIYDIDCSKRLVESLLPSNGMDVFDRKDRIKFTKLQPMEGTTEQGRGLEHVKSALVASRSEEVFSWLLQQ